MTGMLWLLVNSSISSATASRVSTYFISFIQSVRTSALLIDWNERKTPMDWFQHK